MIIKINKYDNQGRGIGYYNNKIVFVSGVLVGEEVEIEILEEKKNYIIARCKNIVKKSDDRIESKCPYYNKCGGCSFLHTTIKNEESIKLSSIKDIFNKEKLDIPNIEFISSDNKNNYRNKISLKVKDGKFGYYNSDSHEFISIEKCLLAKESINKIISGNYINMNNGEVVIRSNYNDEIIIKIDSKDDVNVDIHSLKDANKLLGIIVNNKIIYGERNYIEKVNKYLFSVDINSFFQVNLNILEKIENIFSKYNFDTVVDLYCGVGTLGSFVKKNKLYGIEVVKEAVVNATWNSKINKQLNNHYMLGDSSNIKMINDEIDAIIIDPPRSGLNKETLDNVLEIKTNFLIYMSCNPITFIRDYKKLSNTYDIKDFYLLDMFPRTKHVESVCILERK